MIYLYTNNQINYICKNYLWNSPLKQANFSSNSVLIINLASFNSWRINCNWSLSRFSLLVEFFNLVCSTLILSLRFDSVSRSIFEVLGVAARTKYELSYRFSLSVDFNGTFLDVKIEGTALGIRQRLLVVVLKSSDLKWPEQTYANFPAFQSIGTGLFGSRH